MFSHLFLLFSIWKKNYLFSLRNYHLLEHFKKWKLSNAYIVNPSFNEFHFLLFCLKEIHIFSWKCPFPHIFFFSPLISLDKNPQIQLFSSVKNNNFTSFNSDKKLFLYLDFHANLLYIFQSLEVFGIFQREKSSAKKKNL